jgi:hypothetical protein
MSTDSQQTASTEVWLTAWPIPGVEDVDSDPLDPFGAWEAQSPGDEESESLEDPLLPPTDLTHRFSRELPIDDPANALRRG